MWRACACARVSAVAWLADGVSAKSRPTAAAKATTKAVRTFAAARAILKRLRARSGCRDRTGCLDGIGLVGPVPAGPPLVKPPLPELSPAEAER